MSLIVFASESGRLEPLGNADADAVIRSRGVTIAFGTGDLRGSDIAAALLSDWLTLAAGASILLDSAEAWSAAVVRLGRGALKLHLDGSARLSAVEAQELGLCDLVTGETDARSWLDAWTANRSVVALESAAALIRLRGGDRLERAEFARLFAIGEPQEGLRAFLERRKR